MGGWGKLWKRAGQGETDAEDKELGESVPLCSTEICTPNTSGLGLLAHL